MTDELDLLDATAQAGLVARREITPGELLEACIQRIEKRNPQLNAVIIPLFEKASATVEGDLHAGPFRGVPFVLKDMTAHSAGDPYHEGMRFLKRLNWSEERDNPLVERFRAAGFVIVGRTNVPELGLLPTTEPESYGPTRNPWNLAHSAGGSSGGSAAAVAAGLVAAGHATDGGGSIRIPASACGLVGLKPSRGRVPTGPPAGDPTMDFNADLAVTRSVRDTAAILDAVHGPASGQAPTVAPPRRSYTAEIGSDPGRCRIGIRTGAFAALPSTHSDCVTATEATGQLLRSLGHVVEPVDLPALDAPSIVDHFVTVLSSGVSENLAFWSERTGHPIGPEEVEPLTWALAELSRATPPAQVSAAMEALRALTSAVDAWWAGGVDLMLTPTLAEPPPPLGHLIPGDGDGDPLDVYRRLATFSCFTPVFNLTGQPAISLPLHWTAEGLPVGVQLVAASGREDLLIRVASQLEQASPWHTRRPPYE